MMFGRRAPAGRRCSASWCRPTTSRRTCPPASTRCSPSRTHSGRPGSRWWSSTTARPTTSGAIAESYAARDPRVRVVHTANHGLGAARNEGLRHVTGDLLAFADSDDVVPPGAYAALVRQLTRSGSDFVTGSVARWELEPEGEALSSRRGCGGCTAQRMDLVIDDRARRSSATCSRGTSCSAPTSGARPGSPGPRGSATRTSRPPRWPTCAPGASGSCPEVVYHWRIRSDGTSITQQRSSMQDLRDRWATKLTSLARVEEYGAPKVTVGLPRPGAGRRPAPLLRRDPRLRRRVVGAAPHRRRRHLGLPLAHPPAGCCRSTGWSAGWSSRAARSDAEAVVTYARDLGRPVDRVETPDGRRLDLPPDVLDLSTVAPEALALRDTER